VIVDPGSAACTTEFCVTPAAASTPSPVLAPVVARNPLRVNPAMDIPPEDCLSKDCALESGTRIPRDFTRFGDADTYGSAPRDTLLTLQSVRRGIAPV